MESKFKKISIVIFNVVGFICFIYYAIPYITHNTIIKNPNVMLPAEAWDAAGMVLTLGLIPLIIVNVFGFLFVIPKKKNLRFLWFIPCIMCLILVISYWL